MSLSLWDLSLSAYLEGAEGKGWSMLDGAGLLEVAWSPVLWVKSSCFGKCSTEDHTFLRQAQDTNPLEIRLQPCAG